MLTSIEVTPSTPEKRIAKIAPALEVFITHRPNDALSAVWKQVLTVMRYGFCPVVHVPAHFFDHEQTLCTWLMRLHNQGVQALCVVRGDGARQGPFACSLTVLQQAVCRRFRCWVVAHPHGIGAHAYSYTQQALLQKLPLATGVLTQWCLDTQAIQRVIDRVAPSRPVRVGVCPAMPYVRALAWARRLRLPDTVHWLENHIRDNVGKESVLSYHDVLVDITRAQGGHVFAF